MKKLGLVSLIVLALASCTWVKLTPEAQNVAVLTEADVVNCDKLGETTVSVLSNVNVARVTTLNRSQRKVANELATLARNWAASKNGDAVVAASDIRAGEQSFDIYRCRP